MGGNQELALSISMFEELDWLVRVKLPEQKWLISKLWQKMITNDVI